VNPALKLYLKLHRACSACLIILPLLLTGCAALMPTPPVSVTSTAPVYQANLALSGRISVRYAQNGKEESLHGSFSWLQKPDRIDISLLSPLNQTLATLEITPGAARLIEAGKAPRSAADIETLTYETLGWTLPVDGLRGWLQGFSLDTGKPVPIAQPGAEDVAPVITRDGWKIRYLSWHNEAAPASTRPKRIDLQRTTPAFGEMVIRIVIDSWQQP
jgi:outer membrane lipoprotein LolB